MVRRWTMDYVHERAHKDRSISVWECSDWTVCNAPLLCWFHMHADAACLTEQTLWWSCTGSVWQQELARVGKRRILCPTDARWHDLWVDTDQTRHTVTAHSEAEQLFQVFSLLRWAKRWCLCVCRNQKSDRLISGHLLLKLSNIAISNNIYEPNLFDCFWLHL